MIEGEKLTNWREANQKPLYFYLHQLNQTYVGLRFLNPYPDEVAAELFYNPLPRHSEPITPYESRKPFIILPADVPRMDVSSRLIATTWRELQPKSRAAKSVQNRGVYAYIGQHIRLGREILTSNENRLWFYELWQEQMRAEHRHTLTLIDEIWGADLLNDPTQQYFLKP